jgi:hypothetical protein
LFVQDFSGKTLRLAQQSREQMLGSDMLVSEPFSLLGRIRQYPLALVAQGQVDGSRDHFPVGRVRVDLSTDRLARSRGSKEATGERLVLAQDTEQHVFGLDVRTAVWLAS